MLEQSASYMHGCCSLFEGNLLFKLLLVIAITCRQDLIVTELTAHATTQLQKSRAL